MFCVAIVRMIDTLYLSLMAVFWKSLPARAAGGDALEVRAVAAGAVLGIVSHPRWPAPPYRGREDIAAGRVGGFDQQRRRAGAGEHRRGHEGPGDEVVSGMVCCASACVAPHMCSRLRRTAAV